MLVCRSFLASSSWSVRSVVSSEAQAETCLRCSHRYRHGCLRWVGAAGDTLCWPGPGRLWGGPRQLNKFRSLQVVLSHLRYLNYERNQLAHDASRHLLTVSRRAAAGSVDGWVPVGARGAALGRETMCRSSICTSGTLRPPQHTRLVVLRTCSAATVGHKCVCLAIQ